MYLPEVYTIIPIRFTCAYISIYQSNIEATLKLDNRKKNKRKYYGSFETLHWQAGQHEVRQSLCNNINLISGNHFYKRDLPPF